MFKCCMCGAKYNEKENQGVDIRSTRTSRIYHVRKLSNPNGMVYKFCQNCIKAVTFGISEQSDAFVLMGFSPKYYKNQVDDEELQEDS